MSSGGIDHISNLASLSSCLACVAHRIYIRYNMRKRTIVASVFALFLLSGTVGTQKYVSSQITSRVEREMPKASGVRASIPLADLPGNIASDSIKSVIVNIDSYFLKENNTNTSLKITAKNISKSKPTFIGSLDVTATIPESTIVESAEFNEARIVGDTLQVSVGPGGAGTAVLSPRYSNNQLYFEIQSVSFMGREIPASSLPSDLQSQIKSRSQRSLAPPRGLKVQSVSLSSKGLSLKMLGNNVQLANLGSAL